MTDHPGWLDQLLSLGSEHRKKVFFTKEVISGLVQFLERHESSSSGSNGGADSGGASNSRGQPGGAGGGATTLPAGFRASHVLKNFSVVHGSTGAVLCRRTKRSKRDLHQPLVAVEELVALFEHHHETLGHPGTETLYAQVSAG